MDYGIYNSVQLLKIMWIDMFLFIMEKGLYYF